MKIKHIAIVLGIAAFSISAATAETLIIIGEITAGTCTVGINGPGISEVTLTPVEVNRFNGINNDPGVRADTNIIVKDCAVLNSLRAYFLAGQNVNVTNGRLINTLTGTNVATGVEIQLFNSNVNALDITTNAFNPYFLASAVQTSTNEYTLPYRVGYIQSSALQPTPGKIKTSVEFEMQYQ